MKKLTFFTLLLLLAANLAAQKISELPAAGAISASNLLPVVQSGVTRKATASQILDYIKDNIDTAQVRVSGDTLFVNNDTLIIAESHWVLNGDDLVNANDSGVNVQGKFWAEHDSTYIGYSSHPNGQEDGGRYGTLMGINRDDTSTFFSTSLAPSDRNYHALIYSGVQNYNELSTPFAMINTSYHTFPYEGPKISMDVQTDGSSTYIRQDSSTIIFKADTTRFATMPPEATKVGRIMHINQYGQVEYTTPLSINEEINDSLGVGTWQKDESRNILYPTESDAIKIGYSDSTLGGVMRWDEDKKSYEFYDGNNWIRGSNFSGQIYFIRSGNYIYVRSNLGGGRDIVLRNFISNGVNAVFNFGNDYLISSTAANTTTAYDAGTLIHASSDDIAPVTTYNAGNISGNHGLNAIIVTSTGHDKTSSDIGSRWKDNNYYFYIAEISGNDITLLSEEYTSSGYWRMRTAVNSAALTHISGAVHTSNITVTSQTTSQISLLKNHSLTYKVNGVTDIADGDEGYAGFIEVVESYDITDPSTLVATDPMDWTDGDVWFSIKNIYQFYNYGSVNVYYTLDIKRDLKINNMGAIQTGKLSIGAYDDLLAYHPKVDTFSVGSESWDFQNIDTINNVGTAFYITDSRISRPSNPPDRLIEFLKTDGQELDIGFAMGYNTVYDGNDSTYSASDTTHWYWFTSEKSYPWYISNTGTLSDTIFKIMAYRSYLDPTIYDSVTSVYFNKQGNFDYVYIDAHAEILNDTIPLPSYLIGKNVRLVERENMIIKTGNSVPFYGIVISTTDTWGYAVLELSGPAVNTGYWVKDQGTIYATEDTAFVENLGVNTENPAEKLTVTGNALIKDGYIKADSANIVNTLQAQEISMTSPVVWLDNFRKSPYYYTDFLYPAAAGVNPWYGVAISSGTSSTAAGTVEHPGVAFLKSTTADNTGYSFVFTSSALSAIKGNMIFECIFKLNIVDSNIVRFGFLDATTSTAPVDGAYFEIQKDSIVGKTANNSSISTTSTKYTASAGTWYRGLTVVNSAATRIDYYLYNDSGALLWTNNLTTNIPTARATGCGILATKSKTGTGSVATDIAYVDYIMVYLGNLTR